MSLTKRKYGLLLMAGGAVIMIWFCFGLPPVPTPAFQGVSDGDSIGSTTALSFYGVVAGLLVAFVGGVGLLASIGDD